MSAVMLLTLFEAVSLAASGNYSNLAETTQQINDDVNTRQGIVNMLQAHALVQPDQPKSVSFELDTSLIGRGDGPIGKGIGGSSSEQQPQTVTTTTTVATEQPPPRWTLQDGCYA